MLCLPLGRNGYRLVRSVKINVYTFYFLILYCKEIKRHIGKSETKSAKITLLLQKENFNVNLA